MSIVKLIRNGVVGAVIVAMPVSASYAAVRPNAAIPAAGSAAATAQYDRGNHTFDGAWIPLGIIIATLIVGILIASKGSHGHGDLSLG